MKKLGKLFLLTALAGSVSLTAFADTHARNGFGMGDFGSFSHFGGFNRFGGFGGFGGFGYGMDFAGGFGGFGHGLDLAGGFGGFGHGMDLTVYRAAFTPDPTIVPIPPTASVGSSSITYDENGEIHVRPFDDEDLFVED